MELLIVGNSDLLDILKVQLRIGFFAGYAHGRLLTNQTKLFLRCASAFRSIEVACRDSGSPALLPVSAASKKPLLGERGLWVVWGLSSDHVDLLRRNEVGTF